MCGELRNGTTSKVETHGRIKTEINNKSRVLGVVSWGRDSWAPFGDRVWGWDWVAGVATEKPSVATESFWFGVTTGCGQGRDDRPPS